MGLVQYLFVVLIVSLQYQLVFREMRRVTARQFKLMSMVEDVRLIVTAMAHGASAKDIGEMFQKINEKIAEVDEFHNIAMRARPPWWRRPFIRTPKQSAPKQ